jgi:hypothetical protein
MIQVEVAVPSVDRFFEFEINEHATIASIVEGLASMVATQVGRSWEDRQQLLLVYQEAGTILPAQKTAYQCKIRPGSRLLLI